MLLIILLRIAFILSFMLLIVLKNPLFNPNNSISLIAFLYLILIKALLNLKQC